MHNLNRLLLSEPNAKTVKFTKYGYKLDFSTIIDYAGKRVGIVSRGDVADDLAEFIAELESDRCCVIVCAARTKGEIEDVIASYARRYQLIEVPKAGCHKDYYVASNLAAAHQLAAHVYGAMVP